MNWEKAACLDFAANQHERMFLESWYTRNDNNSINICRGMPGHSACYSLIVSEHAHAEFEHMHKQTHFQLIQISNNKLLVS